MSQIQDAESELRPPPPKILQRRSKPLALQNLPGVNTGALLVLKQVLRVGPCTQSQPEKAPSGRMEPALGSLGTETLLFSTKFCASKGLFGWLSHGGLVTRLPSGHFSFDPAKQLPRQSLGSRELRSTLFYIQLKRDPGVTIHIPDASAQGS